MSTRPILILSLARSLIRGVKNTSVEENGATLYLMLALSGDTSMSAVFCIPSVKVIDWRSGADAVAVRAITWTLWGKMLLENSLRNDSPLQYKRMTKFDYSHTFLLTIF